MPIIKKPEDLDYDYLEKLYEKKIFEDYKPQKITSRKYEEIKVSTDKLTFKLIDKEQRDTVSLIHGEISVYHGIEYFEIGWTYSKYPKQGYLTYLFDLLIFEFDYKLISDKYHTSPGSKEFWQSLMSKKNYKIYRLNLDTNHKRIAKNYSENEIWSLESKTNFFDRYNFFTDQNMDENFESEYSEEIIDYADIDQEVEEILSSIERENLSSIKDKENTIKERIRLVAQK
ncbi:hypothetical protein SAMN05192550_2659 [Flavobacterium glycines]|uniref:Uncharacterized protein n=1 Tax=Flavobacterium glycines TaxID=551990 RepID=A0A1B9DKU7_9FLAO|nr:hypothetical protein [Flavobacterium glycines]OCB70330.1 hypothetical protein FBGL_12235 [Flavobacterium glycines]GEL11629.1 hypothetical protein FGL01_23680 [Flavobacterium glycines]SDJ72365.1 hypothetical protein SAMN05192550_2659 [Flavobacterium glycines]